MIRLVNLIEHPVRELMFWPCNEHIAFFFDLITWGCWQLIGHELRLAPLGYSVAAVLPWTLVWRWRLGGSRESGSRAASLVAVAIVAQSPLVVETAWWYSASSFAWAIVSILVVLLAAGSIEKRPIRSLLAIGLATADWAGGDIAGSLAMPLAILRGFANPKAAHCAASLRSPALRSEAQMSYMLACQLGGRGVIATARQNNAGMADPLAGLGYALTVPGRLLWPSAFGVPASWCAAALTRAG